VRHLNRASSLDTWSQHANIAAKRELERLAASKLAAFPRASMDPRSLPSVPALSSFAPTAALIVASCEILNHCTNTDANQERE
jgi:hypothetical protein